MKPTETITPAEIELAASLGACSEALGWLREEPRTWEEVIDEHAAWLLVHCADRLTPERLDACAAARPWAALTYCADRLTPARLDACAAEEPYAALEYCADRLTPERLDACRKAN